MKFYPGDRIIKITTGSETAAVVCEWETITKTVEDADVNKVQVKEGTWTLNTDIRMMTGEGLPPDSAIVTIHKLIHRTWWNHLRAIFQP